MALWVKTTNTALERYRQRLKYFLTISLQMNKKYSVIYADPAWTYNDKASAGKRGAGFKYDLMTISDIKNLPVQELADTDCLLFLWVTFPLLQEGIDTLKAWGFTYKTVAFNWVKKNKKADSLFWGMGNWTRSNSEICLLWVKGKPKRNSAKVHSVICTPIEWHSKKPGVTRDRIKELAGGGVMLNYSQDKKWMVGILGAMRLKVI